MDSMDSQKNDFDEIDYILDVIEHDQIHDYSQELKEELKLLKINKLLKICDSLIKNNNMEVLEIILSNIDDEYIIKNRDDFIKFFDKFINYTMLADFVRKFKETKETDREKHKLKNKLRQRNN
jgi:hypothetical protein